MENFWYALSLTIFAGLATGLGGLIALYKKPSNEFLSKSLGFSAGIMIYVSMIEIFAKGKNSLSMEFSDKYGLIFATIAFFAGIFVIILIDFLIPEPISSQSEDKLMRMGIMTATAIAIHNFPEGLATFSTALYEPAAALPIFFAIAIHNIPEGISVAIPVYYATKSKVKALVLATLSGLAEPIGALIGYFVFFKFIDENIYGVLFAFVAGIMVYISFSELLPSAEQFGGRKNSLFGIILGMIVMAISLCLFA